MTAATFLWTLALFVGLGIFLLFFLQFWYEWEEHRQRKREQLLHLQQMLRENSTLDEFRHAVMENAIGPIPINEDAPATKRSKELLLHCLTPIQRESFEKLGRFRVIGPSGTIYEIASGIAYNILVLNSKGTPINQICYGPPMHHILIDGGIGFLVYDRMLAQKVDILLNETKVLREGNGANV